MTKISDEAVWVVCANGRPETCCKCPAFAECHKAVGELIEAVLRAVAEHPEAE